MRKGPFILGTLHEQDVFWMQTTGKTEHIPAGSVLIPEGVPLDTFYIVLVGMLSVSIAAKQNEEVARLGIGEVLGEMSFVDSRPSAATVTAVENSLVLSVSHEKLAEKLEQDEGFASRFYKALAIFLCTRMRSTVVQFDYGYTQSSSRPSSATIRSKPSSAQALPQPGSSYGKTSDETG